MYTIYVVFVQQKNVFLLDRCFWRISAIIIYLIYPMIYCIIWAVNGCRLSVILMTFGKIVISGVASF